MNNTQTQISESNISAAWLSLLHKLINGAYIKPRNIPCFELTNVQINVRNPLHNLIEHPHRNLSYRFAVAEWLWIYFGLNDLKTIERYNPRMKEFSDDGVILSGAYGPHISLQWFRIINKFIEDRETRQAVISIYDNTKVKENTKDIPCTLSIQFLCRKNCLKTIVNMRSSDAWLGLPYDFFSFSMLANLMSHELKMDLGDITFNLGSSHLYESNLIQAKKVINSYSDLKCIRSPKFDSYLPHCLIYFLKKENKAHNMFKADEPWAPWISYSEVLKADTNFKALELLKELERRCL